MFYETAQTVGPGWHRSYRPSHYEDMNWSPSSKFRSPGSSPETYRRIIRNDDDYPRRTQEYKDEFFNRRSPTFPRRIFKEVWDESSNRFPDRPRMFKRVFKPGGSRWDSEFEDGGAPTLRKMDREFDEDRPPARKYDEEFERRFKDAKKDIEDEFDESEGRVHHIPIMVERRMEELKSRFGKHSPPEEASKDGEDWMGPQVNRLRRNFEPEDRYHRGPRSDYNSKPRAFTSPIPDTWDPHAIHTLPTRKAHKASQSFDDSRHTVPPKSVFRSYSETHEDIARPQQPHSAAFRSHSDGHCPNKTYVTKIEVNLPPQKERDELSSPTNRENADHKPTPDATDESTPRPKTRSKYDNQSLQQIAVVMQNVEDLVVRVEGYSGTGRDKQFRFLDEMLTRCMLRLDDVDTEGREDIRNARKAAVRKVQACIDLLEIKANECEDQHSRKMSVPVSDNEESISDTKHEPSPMNVGDTKSNSIPNGDIIGEPIALSNTPMRDEPIILCDSPMRNEAIPLSDKPLCSDEKNGVSTNFEENDEKTKL